MKRKFYFYSLLMAIVMMAMSPMKSWAHYVEITHAGGSTDDYQLTQNEDEFSVVINLAVGEKITFYIDDMMLVDCNPESNQSLTSVGLQGITVNHNGSASLTVADAGEYLLRFENVKTVITEETGDDGTSAGFTINEAQAQLTIVPVHSFASLEELIAANQNFDAVNVTIDDEVLVAMLNSDAQGAYMVALKNNGVLLQAPAPDPALNWLAGGRVTGTLNNVSWNSLDNLLHSDDASLWSNLTYTPGVVKEYDSIDELLADDIEQGTTVSVKINNKIAAIEKMDAGMSLIVLEKADGEEGIGLIGLIGSDSDLEAGGNLSGTLTNVTYGLMNDVTPALMALSENILAVIDYTAPAGGSESSDVASVTINGVETTYSDINEALNTAIYDAKTSTLKLLADVEFPYSVPCNNGHDITIDLNNHKYTANLEGEDDYEAFCNYGDSKLTIKNGTLISSRQAFYVSGNSSLNIFNCTIKTEDTGIWVEEEESVVNIVNTNMSSETDNAIYMANGTVNLSGNCRFTSGSDNPIFVDKNGNGVINIDLGYMMVDHNGTKITSFKENIGTDGQCVEVVADQDVVAECAAGRHIMMHHDAVPGTCTTKGKAEYWECTICHRYYADEEGNTRLPFGIIPDTPTSHNYVDGVCANCGLPKAVEPIMVTEENYESLGLDEKYVGYYAIQNLANLAFFAEGFGSHITPATEPEVGEDNGPIEIEARLRTNEANGNDQQQKTRRNAVRKAAAEQGDFLGFVLTNDIVVNANLLDANGKAKDRDNNGNIRADLLAWEPVELHCDENSQLIIDGNGHTISGLYQNSPSGKFETLGFISWADYGITIKNLGITDSYFGSIMEGYSYSMGSLVSLSMANIENCWSDATIDVQNAHCAGIGGLVGNADGGNIYDSYFSGRIMTSGVSVVAGLVDYIDCSDDMTISNCHFSGSMSCKQGYCDLYNVSGLINGIESHDSPYSNIVIERCYADGKIDAKGSAYVSGLFSNLYAYDGGTASVRNNYNAMTVNAENYYGLFSYATGNGIIAFNVNADKNADLPYNEAHIYGYFNISVADEENDYDDGFVIEVTEEQMASGAVAYRLNMLNEMSGPGEGGPVVGPGEGEPGEGEPVVGPVEREPVVPRARLRAAAEETAPVWYQLIGEDAHPVLSGDEYSIVYCDDDEPTPASVFYNKARTIESYDLVDGAEYAIKSKTNVAELTYTRNVSESQVGNWQALYIPFKMPVAELKNAGFDVAAINNFHEYTDEDGKLIGTDLEIKMLTSGTLKENWPYLVRPTVAGEKNITLENVTLAPASENAISCSSIEKEYTFHGTYQPMTNLYSDGYMFLNGGSLCTAANDEQVLKAQRWYLDITNKYDDNQMADNNQSPANANLRISLRVIGEDDASGIDEIRVVSTKADSYSAAGIYDIMGRKLAGMSKGINIIRQSDGTVKKVLITK